MSEVELLTIDYDDGYTGYARYWRPRGAARGAVLYLHGIQSHGEWFEDSAAQLAEAGFHVLLPDRRGSGRNDRERGHARSAGGLLRDVAVAVDWLQTCTGMPTVHLVGVSWGGKLALAAAMRQPERFGNVVLVAPGLFPQVDLPAGEKVKVGLAALFQPQRRFPIPLNEPELFTDNPVRQKYIRDDPLRLREATARFLLASRVLDIRISRTAGRRTWPFAVTLLLAQKERIVDNEHTRRFAESLACRQVRIVEHPAAAHTLEFEPEPQGYWRNLVAAVSAE